MAVLEPIQCQEQWLCAPFLAPIDPIYQMPVYCAGQKVAATHSIPSFILGLMYAYLAPNLLRLKSRATYLDGNLFNLQFRGRGDIPDSSEGGQKEILGRNLRNPPAGLPIAFPRVGVESTCFCSRAEGRVCFEIVMWDRGGRFAALKHLNIVSHPSIHATPRCSVGGGEVHLMFSVPSGLMCPNKGG